MVDVGDGIPDFTATGARREEITEYSLSEYADDRPAVLVFYVHDFSPVCETQMCEINDTEYLTFNDSVSVLGVSTDGPYSHKRFIRENDLSYPLLYDEGMRIHELFDMVNESDDGRRRPKRGLALIDGDRNLRYWWQAEDNWDAWRTDPISELIDVLNEVTNT